MFAGHIGAAYAIGRIERRINVGTFVFFAMFLDFLLWIFVLTGAESVAFPADFGRTHQPDSISRIRTACSPACSGRRWPACSRSARTGVSRPSDGAWRC
jgi:hypothetical protein